MPSGPIRRSTPSTEASPSVRVCPTQTRLPLAALTLLLALLTLAGCQRMREAEPNAPAAHSASSDHEHHDDEHASGASDHDNPHDHGAKGAATIELSPAARRNLGLRTTRVQLADYTRHVAIPAMVTERPGRSQVAIAAPLTGIVTDIHVTPGEAVHPEQPLFRMRLTHEDLVTAQREFLQTAEELDVVRKEIARLQQAGDAIAGRRILEQQYELQKLEGVARAARQGLLLHGLTNEQIDQIIETRELLQSLVVSAPPFSEDIDHQPVEHLYHVQSLNVKRGQHVAAGEMLAVLADHCLLLVEGQAFEEDAPYLIEAARGALAIEVIDAERSGQDGPSEPLQILHLADQVDPETRALRFYLALPNELSRDQQVGEHRFVGWRYRPGQRMTIRLPTGEGWKQQIVLPAEAVVDEGAESYVFRRDGGHFDRVPVHVLYRGPDAVVIRQQPDLIGSSVATRGAYQMHLAIKNRSAPSVDPHAGHSH